MAKGIQSIRGMKDILPEETPLWQLLERTAQRLLDVYGYQEIRLPIVELTALFKRSIGDETDIVEKEMYTFDDRNGDSLTLRPEGTASCVRAGIQNGLLHNQVQRLWYLGPMFRHEKPQQGRYRQFHQIGAEAFGLAGPDIDAELILLTGRLWRELGIEDVTLEINSIGSGESRVRYRDVLTSYFGDYHDQLDEDSRRRLGKNPLRILDSKNPDMAKIVAGAPALDEYLDDESQEHFAQLQSLLSAAKLPFKINARLVRGLDYYSKTVFEWITESLGAQGTICAGGRYDGLVEQFGGRATPAVGFAMGLERLVALMQREPSAKTPHLYVIPVNAAEVEAALLLAESVRDAMPGLRVLTHCGGGGLKGQFRRADRSGAEFAVVLGEEEIVQDSVTLKPLRNQGEQRLVARSGLIATLKSLVAEGA